jgi:hypothetical protein
MAFSTRKQPGPHQPDARDDRGGVLLGAGALERLEAAAHSLRLPQLADDPRYREASRIDDELRTALQRVRDEIDLLLLEKEAERWAKPREPQSVRERMEKARLEALRAKLAASAPPAPVQSSTGHGPAVEAGLAVIAGQAPEKQDRAKALIALRDREEVLDKACGAQGTVVGQTRQELSATICQQLREAHDELLQKQLAAARELARATDQERAFRASILAAGYELTSAIIVPAVRSTLMLGSEQDYDSEISSWGRTLKLNGSLAQSLVPSISVGPLKRKE